MGNFQFISNKNYMKKHSSSGKGTMKGAGTDVYFGSTYKNVYEVNHNLGYVPMFRVYYEPYRDGRIMEGFQDTSTYLPSTPNGVRTSAVAPTCMTYADENKLYIALYFNSNSQQTLDFPIYWTVYMDYGVTA